MTTGEFLSCYGKICFLGIGGVGTSALAVYLKNRGAEVFGFDRDEKQPRVQKLQSSGIFVTNDEQKLPPADAVVYS